MADHTVPHQACPQLSATQKHTPETPHVTYLQRIGKPVYLELCIDASRYTTLLGEIVIVDGMGQQLIHTDVELFTAIRQKYDSMKRGGLFPYMFKPTDIQYVLFGVHGGSASIFRSPLSLPPQVEVDDKRYHYFLGNLVHTPMARQTFYRYFWQHPWCPPRSTVFIERLPKKLGSSMTALASRNPHELHSG